MTPLEKLASLSKAKQGLRKGMRLKDLIDAVHARPQPHGHAGCARDERGPPGSVRDDSSTPCMNHASSHIEAPCTTQAVDMWTMRLNGAGLARGQREYTLPTAQTLAHMPTASHLNLIKEADQHPVNLHCQSPQLSTPFDRSPKASPRVKPELEKTAHPP